MEAGPNVAGTTRFAERMGARLNPTSLSLLTLNCFGGYLPNTSRRLLALARELDRRSDHIVCLQEVQRNKHLKLLLKACGSFSHQVYEPYFKCPKGGLLTFTRIPITSSQFIPYTERGLWYTPMILDRLICKGMLVTGFEWAKIPVVIINTHLFANFIGDWERRGMYARAEEKQLRQLAETVQVQSAETLVIVAGDFNIPRGSRLYHDFLVYSGLSDSLTKDTRPTHRPPKGIPSRYSLPLDYVLVRMPANLSLKIHSDLCFSSKQWLDDRHYDYLSDHNGISVRIARDE